MIPAQIAADIGTLAASLQANAPVSRATPLLKAAMVTAGRALVAEIDAASETAVGGLGSDDPSGFSGAFAGALNSLAAATGDQATLADLRATVGRAIFNLEQV